MQFLFNSDNQIDCDTGMAERVEGMVRTKLNRVEERLTRVGYTCAMSMVRARVATTSGQW